MRGRKQFIGSPDLDILYHEVEGAEEVDPLAGIRTLGGMAERIEVQQGSTLCGDPLERF